MILTASRIRGPLRERHSKHKDTKSPMTTGQTKTAFESTMVKALHALTRFQVEVMNAQILSTISNAHIGKAWDLLWKSVHSCTSLATVIRQAETEQALLQDCTAQADLSAELPAPIVPPDSALCATLTRQIDECLRCAEEMSRHTTDVYESLIAAGQGDSDTALSVSMCRLYAHSVECLLESVQSRLPTAEPIAN